MFFIISKILGYLISPLIWSILCIIISFFYKRKLFLIAGFSILLVFSNSFIFRKFIGIWEPQQKEIPTHIDSTYTVVILGGYAAYNNDVQRIRFFQSSDRLMQGLLVAKKNQISRIILTGGTSNLVIKERPEASIIKEYLDNLKINGFNIVIDSTSRNTHENAVNTGLALDSLNLQRNIVLVTSSWHLKRATGCFGKEGFKIIPVSSDPLGSIEKTSFNEFIIPSSGALSSWEILIREWIGYWMYKMMEYI